MEEDTWSRRRLNQFLDLVRNSEYHIIPTDNGLSLQFDNRITAADIDFYEDEEFIEINVWDKQ